MFSSEEFGRKLAEILQQYPAVDNVKEFGDLLFVDFPSFTKAVKLYFARYPGHSSIRLRVFLNGLFQGLCDLPVARRRGVVDVFVVDDLYKLVLMTIRKSTDDAVGKSKKQLEIFHFGDMVVGERLSVTPDAFRSTARTLSEAGHAGLLTMNHAVRSYDFLRDLPADQVFDGSSLVYSPTFRQIQPLARETQLPPDADHMTTFDDAFLVKSFDDWRARYMNQEPIGDLETHLSLFFAGKVENWRGELQLKIDLQPDMVRIRKADNEDLSESMVVFFTEPSSSQTKFIPERLIADAGSAVVQFRSDTDPRHRYVLIIKSAPGYEVQIKNKIVKTETPASESLSDQLLSAAVPGLQFILLNIQAHLNFKHLTVITDSHFSAYVQGRLLNFGRKSVNSVMNLVRGGRMMNYLFTKEASEVRTYTDDELDHLGNDVLGKDQTRLHLLRETDSGEYTNTNILLAFSNKIVDQEFVRQFVMNNLEALGLQESMYCHYVSVVEGDKTIFDTTTFFLNPHLAARLNREPNSGYENFQPGVDFPFVAQLVRLTDTHSLRKNAFREPSLPASAHLDLLIHASIGQLKHNPTIIGDDAGDLLGYLAGALSADYKVRSPNKVDRPNELQFETTEVVGPIGEAKSKTVKYTFTRNFEMAIDAKDFYTKSRAKAGSETAEDHKEIVYYKNAANEWRMHFC